MYEKQILFIITFYLIYDDIKERTVNEFKNEQLILAKTAAQGITSVFEDYKSDLTFLAQFKGIIDVSDVSKTILKNFFEQHKQIITAITSVNSHGTILYTYPYNQSVIGSDISYQKHVSQVIATHKPVISDVFMSEQGFLAIALHVPVFNGNEFAGSLAILIPIDKLGKLYLDKIKIKGTGKAWLISEMGFSSLLVDYYNDKPKLEQFSEIINLRCNDLLEIINDILAISKIESGQLPVNSEVCNLKDLFAELADFFTEHQKRIGKQHLKFELRSLCYPSEFTILTDKVKLRQIFINLIGNAFKFTETGKIEGGCKFDENDNLVFYVSDTGIGIPYDKQDIIFERFIQLPQNKNISYSGTGLGLSIVKGLITLLGGMIWVESEPEILSEGKTGGTTFYFSIPVDKDRPTDL